MMQQNNQDNLELKEKLLATRSIDADEFGPELEEVESFPEESIVELQEEEFLLEPHIEEFFVNNFAESNNVNYFLFYEYMKYNPNFLELKIHRSPSNKEKFNLKKSLYDRMVNKIMTCKKTHTGKKLKAQKLLDKMIKQKAEEFGIEPKFLLIKFLITCVPNYTVRRLRYGSGHLTKLVYLTIGKKISWFLKTFINAVKKRKKSFSEVFSNEIEIVRTKNAPSFIISSKKESELSALKANIY